MPSSTAGITQYFSDEHTKFRISPKHAMAFIIAVAVLMILLHVFGQSIIG
jgi:preprotein translocase subunit Sec61beta